MRAKDMTNEHLNIQLSMMLGKTGKDATQINYGHISDYCVDRNVSFEAQDKALEVSYVKYCEELKKSTTPNKWYWYSHAIELAAALLSATPRQRAEAAYMTLREEEQS